MTLVRRIPLPRIPLPRIIHIIDAITRHQLLSFLNAYADYNQIPMYLPDLVNTTFITLIGMYCYNAMPFCLKNVGATYQHMMSHIFEPLLDRTMEAYINDMLAKSRLRKDHLAHLQEGFELMRKHQLRLNPKKCAFEVGSRNFLGFLVSRRGIEMAPDK